jgi:hypothetical protein
MSVDDKGKRRKAKVKRSKGKNKDSQRIALLPDFCLLLLAYGSPAARLPLHPAFPFSSVSTINN